MNRVRLQDIKLPAEYEAIRESVRREIIEVKRHRRVQVGDLLSFLFENRETVLFQIQELVRAENITDPSLIQHEIEVYSALLPEPDELSATMFVEFRDKEQMAEEMAKIGGIQDAVSIVIGRRRVRAAAEAGRTTGNKTSTIQYLRFRLPPFELEAFQDPERDAYLVVDHPNYYASAKLDGELRASLIKDLEA